MDSLARDLSRLDMILELPTAQENLAPVVHIKDFMYYYFSRFLTNLTNSFKEFNTSEIQDFNLRHKVKLELFFSRPLFNTKGYVVPIPKGMVKSYRQTFDALMSILDAVSPATLENDVKSLLQAMETGKLTELTLPQFTKSSFDQSKYEIGKLYGKVGLSYATASYVFAAKHDVDVVNTKLCGITKQYYPDILSLNSLLKSVESRYGKTKWTDPQKVILSQTFMTTAYRLSVFAIVMEHVQDFEHAFTQSLDILLDRSQ